MSTSIHVVEPEAPAFLRQFEAGFTGILHWDQFDRLWSLLRTQADAGWYLYAVGEAVPHAPASRDHFVRFLDEMDALLRQEHDEDYCGIVYVDDRERPSFIKIFDPNQLGSSCGSSGQRILPGWVLSRILPQDLQAALPPVASRRRWWKRLLGRD